MSFVSTVANDIKGKVEETVIDLTGTRTHNFFDPLVSNCVLLNPVGSFV